jgi:hypothetical protein
LQYHIQHFSRASTPCLLRLEEGIYHNMPIRYLSMLPHISAATISDLNQGLGFHVNLDHLSRAGGWIATRESILNVTRFAITINVEVHLS